MKKRAGSGKISRVYWLLLHILFLGVFNTIFFLVKGTDNLPSVWISYGAIHLAYFLAWILPLWRSKTANMFGFGAILTVHAYFWLQLVVGIIFIAVEPESWKLAFIVQLLVFFIYAVPTLIFLISGGYAAEGKPILDALDAQVSVDSTKDYAKIAKTKLNMAVKQTVDMELKTPVAEMADLFAANPIAPHKNTQTLENLVNQFVAAVGSKNPQAIQAKKDALLSYLNS